MLVLLSEENAHSLTVCRSVSIPQNSHGVPLEMAELYS